MATKLIIEGNAVYEIDEGCLECRKKKNGGFNRARGQECGEMNRKNVIQKENDHDLHTGV